MGNFNKFNKGRGDRRFAGRDGGRPGMHQAVCNKCGKECEVPFKPTGDRPVFCSNCFEKPGMSGSNRPPGNNFFRPRFDDKRMYEAICAKCGNNCQVPFRPAPGKPVYCNQCFDKGGNVENKNFVVSKNFVGNKNSDQFKQQFEMLNNKLDKILKILNPVVPAEARQEKKTKAKSPKTKIVVKKAKAKKKK